MPEDEMMRKKRLTKNKFSYGFYVSFVQLVGFDNWNRSAAVDPREETKPLGITAEEKQNNNHVLAADSV